MFRSSRRIACSCALLALLASAPVAGDELINGDFEAGNLSGWTDPSSMPNVDNATIGVPTIGAQDGESAARLALANGVSVLTQSFPASPGEEFNLSGYLLADSAEPTLAGNTFQLLKIEFVDENGVILVPESVSVGQFSDPNFPGVDSLPFLNPDSPQDEWIFTEAQGVAPAGTTEVRFFVLNVDFGDDGIEYPKWVDNLNGNNTADGTNLLANPNFETGDFTGWVPEFDPTVANGVVGAPGVGAQEGDFAAELTLANGVSELQQAFPASPGDEFLLEGYMLTENGLPFGPSFGLYKIVFRDADGNDLEPASVSVGNFSPPDFPGVDSAPFLDFSSASNDWILSRAQGVAPEGTVEVLFFALNVDFADGQQNPIWFDNMNAVNVVDGVNLLDNPSFETGDFTGWAPEDPNAGNGSVGAPAVGAQAGEFAGLLSNEAGVGELFQAFPAAPGEEFNLAGFMLTESVIPEGPSFGLYKIVFRDIDGNDLEPASVSIGQFAPPEVPGVESLPFLDSQSEVNIWQFSEAQGVAPEGTVEVLFFALNIDFAGGNNPIWFDSVTAEQVDDLVCDFAVGDINQDGAIDLFDVSPFVAAVTGSEFVCEADINQDGSVDLFDVSSFVSILTGG